MKELTERQREILEFLISFRKRMGRTPTGPEIARQFRFSDPKTAYRHLHAIAEKGYIELVQPGKRMPLGIRFTDAARGFLAGSWALFGSIPAGPLSDSVNDIRQYIEGVEDLLPGIRPGDYFLVVRGDSMIDAGLQDGQYVLVRPDLVPRKGDICAVWIDGEGGTLKHLYREGKQIRLAPANARYTSHLYPVERVRVQGVLVAALAVQQFKR